MKRSFNFRALTSFLAILSFIIVLLTGIALYLAPSGRVAREIGWGVFGITKYKIESLHDVFGYFFAILMIFHLYFNWKIFLCYIKNSLILKREFIIAIILIVIMLVGTLMKVFPFSLI